VEKGLNLLNVFC